MAAAGEQGSTELPELAPSDHSDQAVPHDGAAGDARDTPPPTPQPPGDRAERLLLVLAVLAVECAWLVGIAYGIWRLATLF